MVNATHLPVNRQHWAQSAENMGGIRKAPAHTSYVKGGGLFLFTHLTVERCPFLFIYLFTSYVIRLYAAEARGLHYKYSISVSVPLFWSGS